MNQLDKFIKENPHLLSTKNEIENSLTKCRIDDRKDVISIILLTRLENFKYELVKLQNFYIKD